MTFSLAAQYLIVALVVAAAAASVLRKYLPAVWGRALAFVAGALESARAPALLQRWGARLRARTSAGAGSGCASTGASSCSTCGACAGASTPASTTQVLAEPKPLRRG